MGWRFWKKWKKQQMIHLFAVVKNDKEGGELNFAFKSALQDSRILSITPTRKEALEYIDKRIMVNNTDHFVSWCSVHGLDRLNSSSWKKYRQTVLHESVFREFTLIELIYGKDDIARIFRLMYGYIPVGASYEEPVEYLNVLEKLSEEDLQDLADALEIDVDDIDKFEEAAYFDDDDFDPETLN